MSYAIVQWFLNVDKGVKSKRYNRQSWWQTHSDDSNSSGPKGKFTYIKAFNLIKSDIR